MHMTRAAFLVGVGAYGGVGIVRYPAGAAEFTYKLGLNFPLGYPPGARSAEAAEKIMRDSGGRLEIKVFPAGQLGGNLELISQLRLGALELTLPSNIDLSTVVPVVGMTTLPFLVTNQKEGLAMLDTPVGAYVRSALSKGGMAPVSGFWGGGFLEV
jgi:TRAP-type C4-dicarboxylate transport system substrate-binding protein